MSNASNNNFKNCITKSYVRIENLPNDFLIGEFNS